MVSIQFVRAEDVGNGPLNLHIIAFLLQSLIYTLISLELIQRAWVLSDSSIIKLSSHEAFLSKGGSMDSTITFLRSVSSNEEHIYPSLEYLS